MFVLCMRSFEIDIVGKIVSSKVGWWGDVEEEEF